MAPGGKVCYLGGRDGASAHFNALGMPCPRVERADHLIEIVTEEEVCVRDRSLEGSPPLPPPELLEEMQLRPSPRFGVACRFAPAPAQAGATRLPLVHGVGADATARVHLWAPLVSHRCASRRAKAADDYISIIFFFIAQWSWAPLFQVIGNLPSERDVLTESARRTHTALSVVRR